VLARGILERKSLLKTWILNRVQDDIKYMPDKKQVIIAADHAGFKVKNIIKKMLEGELEYEVEDVSAEKFDETDDYPDFGKTLAERVLKTGTPGIAVCGSGIGMCILLNKYKGIKAGIGFNIQVAELMKIDNNTNILCLPGRILTEDHAKAIARRWLETQFSNAERHVRRLEKIEEVEE